MRRAADVIARLNLAAADAARPFHLEVGPVRLSVLCPDPLRETLVAYFDEALSPIPGDIVIRLLPGQALHPEPDWQNWAREPGKAGGKDAIAQLEDARLVRKLRSGVTFLQAPATPLAFGPLEGNVSTVINFINTQVLNRCLREGWQLCHAAAVTKEGRGLAISGLSGGGKSTSILRMMDIDGTRFVSNDRVLVRGGALVQALGIAKHPRINPGTIVGNPRLSSLLTAEKRAALKALPPDALWALEEKHDLMIGTVYGPGRVQYAAPLTDLWVLNWQRGSAAPTRLNTVDLARRPDLLGAVAKSPGPFYQHPDGRFERNGTAPETGPLLAALAGLRVHEVTGAVDFDALAAYGQALFDG